MLFAAALAAPVLAPSLLLASAFRWWPPSSARNAAMVMYTPRTHARRLMTCRREARGSSALGGVRGYFRCPCQEGGRGAARETRSASDHVESEEGVADIGPGCERGRPNRQVRQRVQARHEHRDGAVVPAPQSPARGGTASREVRRQEAQSIAAAARSERDLPPPFPCCPAARCGPLASR